MARKKKIIEKVKAKFGIAPDKPDFPKKPLTKEEIAEKVKSFREAEVTEEKDPLGQRMEKIRKNLPKIDLLARRDRKLRQLIA